MTMTSRLGVVGVALLTFSVGCSEMATPVSPTSLAPAAAITEGLSSTNGSGAAAVSTTSAISSYPVVYLQADLTASPSSVNVAAGSKVLMVNNSTRYVLVRASGCAEFSTMGLQPGVSRHTMPFYTVGKTCDYYALDYPRKIFVGRVVVQ